MNPSANSHDSVSGIPPGPLLLPWSETLYWSPTSAQPHLFPAWQPEGASSAIPCQSLSLTLPLRASGWLLSSHRVKAKGSGPPDPSTSVTHLLTRAPLTVVPPLPAAPEHARPALPLGVWCSPSGNAPPPALQANSFTPLALRSDAASQGPFPTSLREVAASLHWALPRLFSPSPSHHLPC